MNDIRLSDCGEDVLSFGVGEHNLLVSYPYACCTVELNLEIIASEGLVCSPGWR